MAASTKKPEESLHTKEQVVMSARYADKKDVINALWKDDKPKTISEIDAMIDKYMKGTVK